MNKKQVLKPILFILIFLILLKPITYMIRTNGAVKDRFLGFYAEPDNTLDVVMIGSSPIPSYYITPKIWGEYGITCYPVSSNQQRPRAATYLVDEVLKTQQPSLFIFELRQYTYEESKMMENMAFTRGVTDNMKYSWNRIKAINGLVPEPSERYTYYFDIFKYHSNWKTIVLPEQFTAYRYERLHPLKGYLLQDGLQVADERDFSHVTAEMPIPIEHEEVLYQLLDYLKEKELNALFIVSPVNLYEEEQMKYNYMENIITSYGYPFLNLNKYNDEIGIDIATDYYDYGAHTNARGAEKCTDFLGKYLSENYEFEDKRGKEEYASWDEAYEYWKQCHKEAMETIQYKINHKEYDVYGED